MSKETKDIPDSFHKWAKEQADEKHECRGDMPDSFLYEAAAANEAYIEGALDAYHHLSPSSKPEIGLRWVKASEQLPLHKAHWITGKYGTHDNDFPVRMDGRYYMANIYDERLAEELSPKYMLRFDGRDHYEDEFSEIEWLLDESIPSSEPAKEAQPATKIPHEILHWIHEEWVKDGCRGVFPVWRDSAIATYRHMSLAVPLHAEQSQLHAFNQDMYSAWCEGAATERDDKPKGNLFPYPTLFNIWFERNYLALHARPKPEPSEEKPQIAGKDFLCGEQREPACTKQCPNCRQAQEMSEAAPASPPSVKPDKMRSLTYKESEVLDKTLYRTAKKERSVKPEREDNWISIKESPEEYRQVLLWFEGLKTIAIGYLINGSWADENKNLLWCEPDHWAAMPTPPSHPSSAPPAVQQEDGEVPEEIAKWIDSIHNGRWGFRPGAVAMYHKTQQEIAQINQYRKEGKRYSEVLEEKITNLHKAISALHQEKEDYLKALDRILHDPNKHPSVGRYCSEVLSKYTPQKPSNNE